MLTTGVSFDDIMKASKNLSRRGQVFEAIVRILHIYKLLPKEFEYSKIEYKHIEEFMCNPIATGPDGGADIEFVNLDGFKVQVSIKYTNTFDPIHEGGINKLNKKNYLMYIIVNVEILMKKIFQKILSLF